MSEESKSAYDSMTIVVTNGDGKALSLRKKSGIKEMWKLQSVLPRLPEELQNSQIEKRRNNFGAAIARAGYTL